MSTNFSASQKDCNRNSPIVISEDCDEFGGQSPDYFETFETQVVPTKIHDKGGSLVSAAINKSDNRPTTSGSESLPDVSEEADAEIMARCSTAVVTEEPDVFRINLIQKPTNFHSAEPEQGFKMFAQPLKAKVQTALGSPKEFEQQQQQQQNQHHSSRIHPGNHPYILPDQPALARVAYMDETSTGQETTKSPTNSNQGTSGSGEGLPGAGVDFAHPFHDFHLSLAVPPETQETGYTHSTKSGKKKGKKKGSRNKRHSKRPQADAQTILHNPLVDFDNPINISGPDLVRTSVPLSAQEIPIAQAVLPQDIDQQSRTKSPVVVRSPGHVVLAKAAVRASEGALDLPDQIFKPGGHAMQQALDSDSGELSIDHEKSVLDEPGEPIAHGSYEPLKLHLFENAALEPGQPSEMEKTHSLNSVSFHSQPRHDELVSDIRRLHSISSHDKISKPTKSKPSKARGAGSSYKESLTHPSNNLKDVMRFMEHLIGEEKRQTFLDASETLARQATEIEELLRANGTLSTQLTDSQAKQAHLEVQLHKYNDKVSALKKFMNGLGTDMKSMNDIRIQVNAVIAENHALRNVQQQLLQTEHKLHTWRVEILPIARELQAAVQELKREKESMRTQLDKQSGELVSEKDRCATLEQELKKPKEEYLKMRELMKELNEKTFRDLQTFSELVCTKRKDTELVDLVKKCSSTIENLILNGEKSTTRISEVKELMQTLALATKQHFEEAKSAEEKQPDYMLRVETRVIGLLETMKNDTRHQEDLLSKNTALCESIATLEERLKTSETNISDLRSQITEHYSVRNSLNEQIKRLESSVSCLGNEAAMAEQSCSQMSLENSALKQELEQIKNERAEQITRNSSLACKANELQQEREKLQQRLSESEQKLLKIPQVDFGPEMMQMEKKAKRQLEDYMATSSKQAIALRSQCLGEVRQAQKQKELVQKNLTKALADLDSVRVDFQLHKEQAWRASQSTADAGAQTEPQGSCNQGTQTILPACHTDLQLQSIQTNTGTRTDRLRVDVMTSAQHSVVAESNQVLGSMASGNNLVQTDAPGTTPRKQRRKIDRSQNFPAFVEIPESTQGVPATQLDEDDMLDSNIQNRPNTQGSDISGFDVRALDTQILDHNGVRMLSQATDMHFQSQALDVEALDHTNNEIQLRPFADLDLRLSAEGDTPSKLQPFTHPPMRQDDAPCSQGHRPSSPLSPTNPRYMDYAQISTEETQANMIRNADKKAGPQASHGDMSPPPRPSTNNQGKKRAPLQLDEARISSHQTPLGGKSINRAAVAGGLQELTDVEVTSGKSSHKRSASQRLLRASTTTPKRARLQSALSSPQTKKSESRQSLSTYSARSRRQISGSTHNSPTVGASARKSSSRSKTSSKYDSRFDKELE